jgi:hypothetical protein
MLEVEFPELNSIRAVSFLPQDGLRMRAPKRVNIKVSADQRTWTLVATSADICAANTRDGWHSVALSQPVKARFVQIEILENCGDPDFLTLRGLRFN